MIKKNYLFTLLTLPALLCLGTPNAWGETTTVASGTVQDEHLPYYGFYGDGTGVHVQCIYPASLLSALNGRDITALKFYTPATSINWSDVVVDVRLNNVEAATLPYASYKCYFNTEEGSALVYTGSFTFTQVSIEGTMSFTLDEPFSYEEGKNLLLDIRVNTKSSSYEHTYFYGISSTEAACWTTSGVSYANGTTTNFLPKVTFTHEASATCKKPKLSLSGKEDTSASFSWTQGKDETQWQFAYKSGTTEPSEGDWSDATSATSTTINGLTASTEYTFYLRAYCSDVEQSAASSVNFTTDCAHQAIPATGLVFDFEDVDNNALPDCWLKAKVDNGFYDPAVSTNDNYGTGGSKSLRFNGGGSTSKSFVILPKFGMDIQDLKISFYYKQGSTSNRPQLVVGYITNPSDPTTFRTIKKITKATSWTLCEADFENAVTGAYIALCDSGGTSSTNTYIDSIKIESSQDCSAPTVSSVEQLSLTSARVTWGAKPGVPTYQYCVVAHGADPDWSGDLTVNTNTVDITSGISVGNEYDFYVKCVCGGDASAAYSFSLVSCPSVTGVTLDGKVYNAATVNWTTSAPTNCDVRYKADGDANWTSAGTNLSGTSKAITGLVVGKEYSFQVKPNCDEAEEAWGDADETYAPAFPIPAPSASDITDAQATVSWSALLDNPNYKYIRVAAGSDAPDAEAWESAASTDQTSVTLTSLVGGTSYDVYVRAVYAGGEGEPAKVTFTTTTIAPTNLTQGTTTTSSIAFSWSYAGAATQFQWKSSKSGSNWSDPISVTNAEETGLSDGESYSFDVRAYYADGIYSTILSGSFATACAAKSLPYSCGFENTDADVFTNNGYNNCWKRIGSPYASTSYTYKRAGSRGLYIGGTDEQYAILPVFEDAVKGMQISFWYKNYYPTSYTSTLVLGSMTDPTDKATFTPVKTLDASGSFVQIVEQSLASAGADDHYIAFKYTGANQYSAIALDDILVEVLPSCLKPTGVTIPVENITGTTAQVSWTENGSATAWKIQTSADGTNWSDVIAANSNPFTLTGLTPNNTTYYVRVKADCGGGDESDWSDASDPFQTDCEVISSFPWDVNFTSMTANAVPNCWDNSGSGTSTKTNYPERVWGVYEYNSNKMLRMYNYYVQAGTALINTPSIELPVSPAYELSFDYAHNASCGNFVVKVSTNGGSTFTNIDGASYAKGSGSSEENPGDFTSTTIDLGSYAGQTIILQFFATADYSSGAIFVDNLSIHEKPSCAVPTAVSGQALSTSTASISWTAGGEETAWKLQYSTDGENWTDANGGNNITEKPYELTGLTAATTYYARVKADCGGDLSDWSAASAGFKTDCDAQAMPFEEAFGSTLPECWKMVTVGDNSWVANSSSYYRHSASYSWSYSAYTSAGNYSDLITPAINLDEDALLKFYLYNSYSTDPVVGEVYIQYGSTTEKIYDFVTTSNIEQQIVDLSEYTGKTAKFIFRAHGNGKTNYRYASIDDVEVKAKPCDAPTAVNVTASSSDATITWADENNDKWNLRWHEVTEPANDEWTVLENLDAKSYTISSGLEVGKTYEVQVQSVCLAKTSTWYPTTAKTFELVCSAPTVLAVTARTANSATFSWTSSETSWVLQYTTDGENWESENVAANPFTLEGLTAGQSYQAKIQTSCGSAFSNVVEFSTWCDSKLSLPVELTSFTAIPACWEESPAGAVEIANSKLCFVGEGEKFLYLPQTDVNLNLLSATFTFSGSLEFGYIDAPNGAFQAFETQPTSGVELNMEGEIAAAKYIAIRYNGSDAWSQASISAISIRKTPTCLKPTDVTATPAVGAATINWTSEATAWKLQYKLASAASWSEEINVATKPYNLMGLAQGTSYKVRVQAACAGEELSDWSDEASFITDCEAVAALPFVETFDADLSNCWNITDDDATYYAHNVYGGELNLPGGKATSGHLVVLPEITASLTNAVVTIEYTASTDVNTAIPQVGYMNGDFVELVALDKSATEARIPLASANGHRLALRYDDGTSEGTFAIREIRILNQAAIDDTDIESGLAALVGQTVDFTVNRTFKRADYFNTLCLPFSLSEEELANSPFAGAELWTFKYASVVNDELQVRIQQETSIKAGRPYLILFGAGEDLVNPLFKNVTITATSGEHMNYDNIAFIGTLAPVAFAADDANRLFLTANNLLAWANTNGNVRSFRAYFEITPSPNPSQIKRGMRARIVMKEEVATGIEDVQGSDVQSTKVLENNQVLIIRNGVKYNLQGQVVK